jgi:aminomethyltransferase
VGFDVKVAERPDFAMIAIQGPGARDKVLALLSPQAREAAAKLGKFSAVEGDGMFIARTGYTGEDGFELYFPNESAVAVWNAIMERGDVMPAGLGARDTLRLEMGMALYGNDIDDSVTPLEAGLQWLVKLKKGEFVGRDALVTQKEAGLTRKLVGFTTTERSFPRHGYPVFVNGERSGDVKSGTMSPSLNIPIGTAYLPAASTAAGTSFEIEIRGKRIPAVVEKMPFYKEGTHL